ncbi:MAG TPA: DUF4184 family protein [Jiangellales bacterium]|nr:DUF4184 family protein [Jiangellales bacterium]
MPLTIPTHPAAALPFKLWRPRWFDGVALVTGTAAPDAGYVLAGIAEPAGHAWHALFWFDLPVAVLLALALRRAAPHVAAHLPAGGPLALRDYAVLGRVRHPLAVTTWSALLGAATHQIWDAVTHPGVLLLGAETRIAAMHVSTFAGLPWWRVCQLASESLGAIAALTLLVHIGRLRLLRRWHGDPPDVPRRPLRFWATATAVFAVLVAALPAVPGNEVGHWVVAARILAAAILAGLTGAAVAAAAQP